jgi:hypothetical protein
MPLRSLHRGGVAITVPAAHSSVVTPSSSSDLGRSHENVAGSSAIKMTHTNSNGAANVSGGEVQIQMPAGQLANPNPWTITVMVVCQGN